MQNSPGAMGFSFDFKLCVYNHEYICEGILESILLWATNVSSNWTVLIDDRDFRFV